MSPFKVKKITNIVAIFQIVFPFGIAFDMKHSTVYMLLMGLSLAGIIITLLKYWKCPHCKEYFPVSMSLKAKHCPACGEKLQ